MLALGADYHYYYYYYYLRRTVRTGACGGASNLPLVRALSFALYFKLRGFVLKR
jgi:hypothetical protein